LIIESPLYELTLKKRIFKAVIANAGISKYIVNFLNILLEKDRISELSSILQSYYDIISEVSGKAKASVVSAVELSQAQQLEISKAFSNITKKQVEIDMSIDPSLIGGLIVEVEGMVYDGSIKSQLIKFKEILKGEM
jgi:F-type H+-transporting ATPase subunit delta